MTEIHWMAATGLMTALFWMVYVLNRFAVIGIPASLGNPNPEHKPLSDWAQRATAAHQNAMENFPIFAALVLGVVALNLSSSLTITLSMLYFFALGIPVARTLTFVLGWIVQVVLAMVILGVV